MDMDRDTATLGDQELELLTYITENAPITVREATQGYGEPKGLARTTILTMMERLRSKGYLTRTEAPGVNRYLPVVGKTDLLRGVVRNFVANTLGGSLSPFVAYLAQDAKPSPQEMEDLKRLVKALEEKEGK